MPITSTKEIIDSTLDSNQIVDIFQYSACQIQYALDLRVSDGHFQLLWASIFDIRWSNIINIGTP